MSRFVYLLLCLPCPCFAQLNGEFTNTFTTPLLWDFSGSYAITAGAIQAEHNFIHASSGAVTGHGIIHYNDGVTRLTGAETMSGRVHGVAGSAKLDVAGRGSFSGTVLGQPIAGPFNGNIALMLIPPEPRLTGTESATACVSGRGCRTVTTNVSFALPAGMDGTWTLALNLTTTNHLVRGTAIVTLSNGRMLSFKARGRYVAADGISRLTLNGVGSALGRRLAVRLDTNGQLQTLNGQLFGQRLIFP